MKRQYYITTKEHRYNLLADLGSMGFPEFGYHVEIKTGKRTSRQRNAMEVYFRLLAKELNNAGLDMRVFLKESVTLDWEQASVKKMIWHPIMKIQTDKDSTADLDRDEISPIYDTINRHIGEKHGIYVPFPERRLG